MSKKIGMVAFRSSASGMSVISNIGPTMPGMKQILFWPGREEGHVKRFSRCTGPPPTKLGERNMGGGTVKTIVNTCNSCLPGARHHFEHFTYINSCRRCMHHTKRAPLLRIITPLRVKRTAVYKSFHLHDLLCKRGPDGICYRW